MKNIIEFEFKKPGETPDGLVRVSVSDCHISECHLPLRFVVYNNANAVVWSTDLYPNMFSLYYEIPNKRIEVSSAQGNSLLRWDWNVFVHGDICHQLFYLWSLENRGSKGMAIGTHDGTSGEWVGPVSEGLLRAVLVEPSDKQFSLLSHIYSNKSWISIEQSLVTPDGSSVVFYEGGRGHTNSINKEHLLKYEVDITQSEMESTTVNDLARRHGIGGVWWLHLDVEDLDDMLMLSIADDNLPSCIVFEHEQLNKERLEEIGRWLSERSYSTNSSYRNTICIR